jgi:hypothetical protein
MPETSLKLSNTARSVLILAATRDDRLVRVPQLPVAAARQVIRSLLNAGLVEEIPAPAEDADFAWRTAENGAALILRATIAGLACVSAPASTETAETSVVAEPDHPADSEGTPPPAESTIGQLPASAADAMDAHGRERTEDSPGVAVHVDASIAPLVNTFISELMQQERATFVAAFVRRLDRETAERGSAATGTKRAREMSVSQRRIIELCSRPEGATGKELAEGCGWPSIAARTTCRKIADRFGYILHESPKATGRGISFRLTAKPAQEA